MLPVLVQATRLPLPPSSRPGGVTLRFRMQHQEQTNWCWAAVTVSIALFYKPSSGWSQCLLANKELNQTSCCQNGASQPCNRPWCVDIALQHIGHLAEAIGNSIPFPAVMQELKAQRPIAVVITWSGGQLRHAVVLIGATVVSPQVGKKIFYVTVQDPETGKSTLPYDVFRTHYQKIGTWTGTVLTHP